MSRQRGLAAQGAGGVLGVGFVVNQINILRPCHHSDILAAGKMRALNPEYGRSGTPGTVKIFDDAKILRAVDGPRRHADETRQIAHDIKKDVKMPEYASWGSQERMPTNIEAAYKALGGKI
jgi:hypothetical protein